MYKCLSKHLAGGAAVLTDDELAARQLEIYLALNAGSPAATAWPSDRISSFSAWAIETWNALRADRLLLSPTQSRALWAQVVGASNHGPAMIHARQLAASARSAWQLLQDWDLSPDALSARDGESTFAAFLDWTRSYQARLRRSNWIDAAQLPAALATEISAGRLAPGAIVFADYRHRRPVFTRLTAVLEDTGVAVSRWSPEHVSRDVRMATHADREDETNSAFTWCLERLERDASARLAVVIPPAQGLEGLLERWEHTLEKRFESDSGGASIVRLSGRQVGRRPVIGAALDLLTLFSSTGSFPVLSRVLRSPFLGMTEENRGRAAMLEGELREDLSAQASFIEAFRFGGLRVRLNRALPELAEGLVVLMQQLEGLPLAQTTTAWGRFMHEVLVALGWPGTECVVAEDDLDAWYRAVAELAELTPILGALSFDRALAELERIVSRARITEAPSLRGVSMFTSLEQVGVGYDAAWVAGMSDSAWPGPSRPHALFPLGLQRAHDMPDATPETALLQRQSSIDDLVARVPDLVFSYARIEDDLPVGASPLIGDLAPIESSPSRRASVRAVEPVLADAIEEVDDPVPALDGRNVPGGASTLALQARCPLRAFIEARLDARPLSRQERGIGPRLRGILVHRALELFYADCGGKGELDAMPDAELEARIRASIDRSFRERLHVVGGTQRGLRALERERLGRLILSLVDADRQRDEFSIEARELRTQVELLGRQISCRIDRVDRLADGRLAIIDYKTGRPPTSRQWLASRLIEPQLPLYVQAVQESVGAIIVAVLRPEEVVYRGLWDVARAFPGRAPAVDWQQQCMDWSAQISTLVAEFIAGDGRVFAGAIDQAVGPFAPLTRACGLTQDAFEAETGSES